MKLHEATRPHGPSEASSSSWKSPSCSGNLRPLLPRSLRSRLWPCVISAIGHAAHPACVASLRGCHHPPGAVSEKSNQSGSLKTSRRLPSGNGLKPCASRRYAFRLLFSFFSSEPAAPRLSPVCTSTRLLHHSAFSGLPSLCLFFPALPGNLCAVFEIPSKPSLEISLSPLSFRRLPPWNPTCPSLLRAESPFLAPPWPLRRSLPQKPWLCGLVSTCLPPPRCLCLL